MNYSVRIRKNWPLFGAVGILWITAAILLAASLVLNDGHFIYALDDTYIHMAIAKNVAQRGVWGITAYEFTSSSSSLLWTLLLSATNVLFGVTDAGPFLWNLIFATLLVLASYLFLKKYSLKPLANFIVLIAIIFFAPLPLLLFYGLEHIMHALYTIAFVFVAVDILSGKKLAVRDYGLAVLLGLLLTMSRYEGLFLIFAVCILLLLKKRLFFSLLLGGVSAAPLAAYGLISTAHGWYFLPNSVLLKGNIPDLSIAGLLSFIYQFLTRIVENPHFLILLGAASLLLAFRLERQKTFWERISLTLAIFLVTSLLHLMFSTSGLFSRYDAYLVVFGVISISIGLNEFKPRESWNGWNNHSTAGRAAIVLSIAILISPLLGRAFVSLKKPVRATANIYDQQYQMGSFLRQFYQGKGVAANDIGVINYLADIRCLDLYGLASLDVAKSKMTREYSTRRIQDIARQNHIAIAIVYDSWFQGRTGLPKQWSKVGEWILTNNIICGGDTVSFYAVDSLQKSELIENLRAYSPFLPKDNIQYDIAAQRKLP